MEAVRLLGYSRTRIYLRHFLPNVSSETIAYGLSDFILVIMLCRRPVVPVARRRRRRQPNGAS